MRTWLVPPNNAFPPIVCASTNRQIQIKEHECPEPNTHCSGSKDLLKVSATEDLLQTF